MGASLLRLFFHDCFVNGCDASVLLDDTPTFTGEKNAAPNKNSIRGFEVIDAIKAAVEEACPGFVSCADILTITARDSVVELGGPYWDVKLGRRDARTASQAAANTSIPAPTNSLDQLITSFHAQGLSVQDMVALSGAHTIGLARCTNFRNRTYHEKNINGFFAKERQESCPRIVGHGDNNLSPLDVQSPTVFDNNYYKNLLGYKGLLHSDQQLFNGGSTDSIVHAYAGNPDAFYADFIAAMIKMGDNRPLTGTDGEIRMDCRKEVVIAMASFSAFVVVAITILGLLIQGSSHPQLSPDFYSDTCPDLLPIIEHQVQLAVAEERRIGASLLRLFFHDCFVNGCDASVLFDDTLTFTGEKNAAPNKNSIRGFEVIDAIKAAVEEACFGVVSCADILTITARDSVVELGGPYWDVKLGRRDARTASQAAANTSIPAPTNSLDQLITSFHAQGLSVQDMIALSGAHTIGLARCTNFRNRTYHEKNINGFFAKERQESCPRIVGHGDNNLAPLDVQSPTVFDNNYYKNLLGYKGLLHSDQQLFNGGSTDSIVDAYAENADAFYANFIAAMIKMGDNKLLTGTDGEIRMDCRKGHTPSIGLARCTNFKNRTYHEKNINGFFAKERQESCPRIGGHGDNNLAPLDVQTPTVFVNNYYKNLLATRASCTLTSSSSMADPPTP
ncbi:Peroxidase 23 [Nymphaea thermarum]|nr:Peroxidase 23 [Nymphaea thermarum]